jgi:DoxX-like family
VLFDGAVKLVKLGAVVQATSRLGFPENVLTGIRLVLLTCTILYLIPRTAVLQLPERNPLASSEPLQGSKRAATSQAISGCENGNE